MTEITRATAESVIAKDMEGRAENLRQARLLFNPDREVNSIFELAAALLRPHDPAEIAATLAKLAREAYASNASEGELWLEIAGEMEAHLACIRSMPASERITAKSTADALRAPLDVLVRPDKYDGIAYYQACCAVRDVIRRVPRDELLQPAVENHLGGRKYRKLAELASLTEEAQVAA